MSADRELERQTATYDALLACFRKLVGTIPNHSHDIELETSHWLMTLHAAHPDEVLRILRENDAFVVLTRHQRWLDVRVFLMNTCRECGSHRNDHSVEGRCLFTYDGFYKEKVNELPPHFVYRIGG